MRSALKSTIRRISRCVRLGTILSAPVVGRLYGDTDKVSHGYLPYYQRHFRHRRYRDLLVIEIGVGGIGADRYESIEAGGSLRVWRDYFARSTIVGVDIHPKKINLGNRVRFVQADQSCRRDLDRVLGTAGRAPDIVIDDGSHLGDHVRTTFEVVFPRLALGGVYVIEDLHTSYWPSYGGDQHAPLSSAVGLLRELIDAVQSRDATFARRPDCGPAPATIAAEVASLSIYPGIAFIQRRSRTGPL